VATDNFWGKFRRWRRHRPFWGGLLLVLSAFELFLSGNMNLNGMSVHLGPQGFLSYLLPVLLLVCGLLTWFSPAQKVFYGVVALLTALYTFIGLNLGGFVIGMLLGIVGGSMAIAWGPPRIKPDDKQPGRPPAGGGPGLGQEPPAAPPGPIRPATRDVETTAILPGLAPREDPRGGGFGHLGKNPKTFVVALVALTVTASFLVAGSRMPASAEECPEGLPFRSASAAAPATSSSAVAEESAKAAATPTKSTAGPAKSSATPATSASSSAAPSEDLGQAIADGFEDFVDGVGDLLGIGDKASSSPSVSPTPSGSGSAVPSPTKTTSASPAADSPAADSPSAATSGPASASADPDDSAVPCLGDRQFGLQASADDIPRVAAKPGLMEVDSLTMYNSTYDGVVDMPTKAGGTFKALKFSMDKAVNKPFSLTIDEPLKAQTVITSKELTTEGTVKFYTPEFKGKLFGLIPVTFTPEHPPPLTLPILWFTDAKIKLAYVRCDVLTADPMLLREKS
jgi:hypothetical protein